MLLCSTLSTRDGGLPSALTVWAVLLLVLRVLLVSSDVPAPSSSCEPSRYAVAIPVCHAVCSTGKQRVRSIYLPS